MKLNNGDRRHRGPITNWNPRASTRELIADVLAVLNDLRDYWSLTVRQSYYQLLGTGRYAKSDGLANRVSEHVTNARRAEGHPLHIPWQAITDQSLVEHDRPRWRGADEWLDDMRSEAENFRLDRQQGQPTRMLLWCEAAGMVPMLGRTAEHYGVRVISTSGYDSTTTRHAEGVRARRMNVPLTVLHIGDLDDDGRKIFKAMAEDVSMWAQHVGGRATAVRLAVTEEQMEQLGLPDDPEKPGKVQAEAIPPDVLSAIVREAIASRQNADILAETLEREEEQRNRLLRRVDGNW